MFTGLGVPYVHLPNLYKCTSDGHFRNFLRYLLYMKRQRSYTTKGRASKKRRTGSATKFKHPVGDVKYTVDAIGATASLNTGSGINVHSLLVRGTAGINNFDGMWVAPTSISLRYRLLRINAADMVRLIVLQVVKGAVPPTPANLLNSVGLANTPLQPFNRAFKMQCKILIDRLHQLNNIENGQICEEIYIKGKKLRRIEYDPAANTVTNGGIYVYHYSQAAAGGPTVEWVSNMTFVDQ